MNDSHQWTHSPVPWTVFYNVNNKSYTWKTIIIFCLNDNDLGRQVPITDLQVREFPRIYSTGRPRLTEYTYNRRYPWRLTQKQTCAWLPPDTTDGWSGCLCHDPDSIQIARQEAVTSEMDLLLQCVIVCFNIMCTRFCLEMMKIQLNLQTISDYVLEMILPTKYTYAFNNVFYHFNYLIDFIRNTLNLC